MSETSQGEGWWQASDLLWYPPRSGEGGDGLGGSGGEGSGGRGWVLPTVLVVVVALVAAGVTFVVADGGDEAAAESVALEPVASVGVDPFTDSVAVNEVAEFPESVSAVIDVTVGELPTDEVTGTLVAAGSTPGLYGGTTDDSACDLAASEGFLTDPDNAAKAAAWAGAAGVAESDIGVFLSELAPTVLTLDTRVTNHGFRDGKATPRQSVLQAGSAVLVDALGVPRVRCSCGNPLAEPEQLDLTVTATTGVEWATYTPGRTAVAQPAGDRQDNLTLLDTTTADTYQAPVGESTATVPQGIWIAATAQTDAAGETVGGAILTSPDGAEWSEAATIDRGVDTVAASDDMIVALASSTTYPSGETEPPTIESVALRSADGITWSEPAAMDTDIGADSLAYGDSQWAAVGATDDGMAVLQSGDGTTWSDATRFDSVVTVPEAVRTRFELDDPEADLRLSDIHHVNGEWVMTASLWPSEWFGEDGLTAVMRSEDLVTWTDPEMVEGLGDSSTFAHNGELWGAVASLGSYEDIRANAGMAAELADLEVTPVSPPNLSFARHNWLTWTGAEWVTNAYISDDLDGPLRAPPEIWTSADLSNWTKLGVLGSGVGQLTDLVVT